MFGKYKKLYEQTLAERNAAWENANALVKKLAKAEEDFCAEKVARMNAEADLSRFLGAASEPKEPTVKKSPKKK